MPCGQRLDPAHDQVGDLPPEAHHTAESNHAVSKVVHRQSHADQISRLQDQNRPFPLLGLLHPLVGTQQPPEALGFLELQRPQLQFIFVRPGRVNGQPRQPEHPLEHAAGEVNGLDAAERNFEAFPTQHAPLDDKGVPLLNVVGETHELENRPTHEDRPQGNRSGEHGKLELLADRQRDENGHERPDAANDVQPEKHDEAGHVLPPRHPQIRVPVSVRRRSLPPVPVLVPVPVSVPVTLVH